MMTTPVKCSNSIFMVKSTRKSIDRKHDLHSMLRKGNVKAQITTGAKNSEIQKRQYNRRLITKFIKTIYFKCRKKWAVKNNFHDVMKHIKNLGDEDFSNNG